MSKFIMINKDWDSREEGIPFPEDRFSNEIFAVESIKHVYTVLPGRTSLCYEFINYKGNAFEVHETFPSIYLCERRLDEVLKILNSQED